MLIKSIRKIFKVNILTQLIGLIIIPLLALSYDLQDLGYYAFIFSLSSLLANFFVFRIENTFFSSSIDSVELLLFPIILISLILFCLSCLFIWLFFFDYKYIVAVYGAWLISLFNLIYCYNVRKGAERLYNLQKIIRVICELLVVGICILFSLNIEICVLMVLSTYWIFLFNKISLNFRFDSYLNLIKEKKDLILSDLISASLFSTYNNGPVLFLSNIDLKLSGLYFILYKFLMVPSLMIAQSLGTVLKQYASIEYEVKKNVSSTLTSFKEIIIKFKSLILLALLLSIVAFYFLDYMYYNGLFLLFLIMIPCVSLRFIHLSYSSLVYVLSMQKSYLMFNIYLFGLTFLSKFLASKDGYLYLLTYSVFSCIGYILYAFYFFKISRK